MNLSAVATAAADLFDPPPHPIHGHPSWTAGAWTCFERQDGPDGLLTFLAADQSSLTYRIAGVDLANIR